MRQFAKLAFCLATLLVVGFCSTTAQASIVGIGNYAAPAFPGMLYSVDPITGAVALVGTVALTDWFYPISSGPGGGYFALSPVNHYLVSYPAGTAALWECYLCGNQNEYTGDYAYDASNGKIFSIMTFGGVSSPGYFVQMLDAGGIPGYPGSHFMVPSVIKGSPDFTGNLIMEVIQGLGLYATDGYKAFLIDEITGAETAMPSLSYLGPRITGLAYDPDSGRLIGTTGVFNAPPGTTGYIYSVDPVTGQVTVLNSNAPNMMGLAAVPNPEPSTVFLLAGGLFCLWWMRRSAGSRYTNG